MELEGEEEVSCAFGGCDKLAMVKDERGTWFSSRECAELYYMPLSIAEEEQERAEMAMRHQEEDVFAAEELMNRNYEEDKDPFEESPVTRNCWLHKDQVLDYRFRCGECEKAIAEAPEEDTDEQE